VNKLLSIDGTKYIQQVTFLFLVLAKPNWNMSGFLHEDGRGNIIDDDGNPTTDFLDWADSRPVISIANFDSVQAFNLLYNVSDEKESQIEETEDMLQDDNDSSSNSTKDLDPISIDLLLNRFSKMSTGKRKNRVYTDHDKRKFFYYFFEHSVPISEAARQVGLPPRIGQKWMKKYNNSEDGEIPMSKPRGRIPLPTLNSGHKTFLYNLVDENASITLEEMMKELTDNFEGLKVSQTSLYRFIKEEVFSLSNCQERIV